MNIEKMSELFPSVVTEKEGEDGKTSRAINFELLKQELSNTLVEDTAERYQLSWPGKKASLLKANTPISKTLRPDYESSINFENTRNVFIEGDNFEALKILQESYLGKVKMIYIDPPYNTGTAMIYNNDFSKNKTTADEDVGAIDSEGVKMFRNTDSNGRFHSDWLSMMFERIVVGRDLLKENGFMVLAIDHNELHNLISICDEIFGEGNRLGIITVVHKPEGRNQEKFFGTSNEFMLVYAKNIDNADFFKVVLDEALAEKFDKSDDDGNFKLKNFIRLSDGKYSLRENKPHFYYPVYVSDDLKDASLKKIDGYSAVYPITEAGQERTWKTTGETFLERFRDGNIEVVKNKEGDIQFFEKLREDQVVKTHWVDKKYHGYHFGTKIIDNLLGAKTFDFPKSLPLMMDVLKLMLGKNDLILDFFSGSATTAHAVMQQNAEDGGSRKFIMVQLPEETLKDSEASKAGYKTITEIGRERIRRASTKIKEDFKDKLTDRETPLDTGFRSYVVADTNMKDVQKHPNEFEQGKLMDLADNIKEDRTATDLLTQVMLELGLTLDLPIEEKKVGKNTVFYVSGNSLVACFDEKIPLTLINEIAKSQPLKVVFKDASFANDDDLINSETHLKRLSPDTTLLIL